MMYVNMCKSGDEMLTSALWVKDGVHENNQQISWKKLAAEFAA